MSAERTHVYAPGDTHESAGEKTAGYANPRWMDGMGKLTAMACMREPLVAPPNVEILSGRLYVCGLMGGELYRAVAANVPKGERFTVLSIATAHDLQSCAVGGKVVYGPLYDQVRRLICSTMSTHMRETTKEYDDLESGPGTFVSVSAAERYAILHKTNGGSRKNTEQLLVDLFTLNTGRPRADFDYIYVPMNDGTAESAPVMQSRLPLLLRQIDEAIVEREERVFVHCRVGVSRSVSVVMAYIVTRMAVHVRPPVFLRCNSEQLVMAALEYVRRMRPFVCPWGTLTDGTAPRGGYIGVLTRFVESPTWQPDTVASMMRSHQTARCTAADQGDGILDTLSAYVMRP